MWWEKISTGRVARGVERLRSDDRVVGTAEPLWKGAVSSGFLAVVCLWCAVVVLPLMTVAVVLALVLLVIVVAGVARYARKYCCCCWAPRAGSYTPSPSPTSHRRHRRHAARQQLAVTGDRRQQSPPPQIHKPREPAKPSAEASRAVAQLAKTEPAYRSIVIIGSDRVGRRVRPTGGDRGDLPRPPRWRIVRQTHGNSSWGNLSLVNAAAESPLPPPPPAPPAPPLPSQTIILDGRSSTVDIHDDDDDEQYGTRTVPAIVNLLEARMNVDAQVHDSQPKLQGTK